MILRTITSVFIILFFFNSGVSSQERESRYSVNIGLGAQKIGLPFRKVLDIPVHGAYQLGVRRKFSSDIDKRAWQSVDLYLFTNKSAGSGYMISTSFGGKILNVGSFFISPAGGLGVFHMFRPKESYYLEDGIYKLNKDKGIIRPELHLGIEAGYGLNRIDVFGSYQCSAMYNYSSDVKVLPLSFLIIGIRYEI